MLKEELSLLSIFKVQLKWHLKHLGESLGGGWLLELSTKGMIGNIGYLLDGAIGHFLNKRVHGQLIKRLKILRTALVR